MHSPLLSICMQHAVYSAILQSLPIIPDVHGLSSAYRSIFLLYCNVIGFVLFILVCVSDRTPYTQRCASGVGLVGFFVIVLGLLLFPAGPFIRPHPLVWRFVFGKINGDIFSAIAVCSLSLSLS